MIAQMGFTDAQRDDIKLRIGYLKLLRDHVLNQKPSSDQIKKYLSDEELKALINGQLSRFDLKSIEDLLIKSKFMGLHYYEPAPRLYQVN